MNSEVSAPDKELSCRELAVLAAPTCFLVVKVYTGLRTICPEEYQKCQDAIMDKYQSLKIFRCRWGIAGTFIIITILLINHCLFITPRIPTGYLLTTWPVRPRSADKMMRLLNEAYGVDWYQHRMIGQPATLPPPPQANGNVPNSWGPMDMS